MVAFSSAERSPRGVTARATGCAPCAAAAAVIEARSSALSKRRAAGFFTGRAKEKPKLNSRSSAPDRSGEFPAKAGLRQLDLASAYAARRKAAEPRRRAWDEDRRGSLPAQLLQLTHRSIHAFFSRVAIFLHGVAQTRSVDFETDRQRPHVSKDLRFPDIDRRPRLIGSAVARHRSEHPDRSRSAVGVNVFAVQRRGVHLRLGAA